MGRLLYRYCTENVKFRHVHCCNCMFAEDYCSYSLNTKLCLGKRWKFYQYITFASASGGLSHRPPTRALPWTPGGMHPQTSWLGLLLKYVDPRVNRPLYHHGYAYGLYKLETENVLLRILLRPLNFSGEKRDCQTLRPVNVYWALIRAIGSY